ncbi:hypothetical protein B6N60_03225 [Richelia sinica FACHB-800]|uniref:Uncharacterized protein n=2 Tax=Richelia TaxID=98443 RepID=A0A975T9D5_9NOST|nr:hypothetical protein [Richelia sinica FACHB-800]QXE24520.1 hypothetical protein B6N60_03225 [Richelia sinica FACHB-800]
MHHQKQKKTFQGMSYRQIQCNNSEKKNKLNTHDKIWLKNNGYKNIGWDNVINLYQKIQDFLDKGELKELTLEELFLEADRIGNKYFSNQEIQDFHSKLAKEVNEIAEEIDKHFPDTEIEIIDFSSNNQLKRKHKTKNQKIYKTSKI